MGIGQLVWYGWIDMVLLTFVFKSANQWLGIHAQQDCMRIIDKYLNLFPKTTRIYEDLQILNISINLNLMCTMRGGVFRFYIQHRLD